MADEKPTLEYRRPPRRRQVRARLVVAIVGAGLAFCTVFLLSMFVATPLTEGRSDLAHTLALIACSAISSGSAYLSFSATMRR